MERPRETVRVAIISSDCGGSEVAARSVWEAVRKRLRGVEAELVYIDDLWLGHSLSSYDWYLYLARFEYYRLIRIMVYLEKRIFKWMQNRFRKGLTAKLFVEREAPHLIISTVPFLNHPLFEVAKTRGIPVFVLATDIDSDLFSFEWPKGDDLPPHRFGVMCDHEMVLSRLDHAIDRSKLVITGGFVRGEFTEVYSDESKRRFCEELGLPTDRDVISMMMGSLGGRQLFDYAKSILDSIDRRELVSDPHFVILCAKNGSMKRSLERLVERRGYFKGESGVFQRPFGGASFSIVGYTNEIHKYYSVSKGLITKPGGGSINEALALHVPLIIDNVNGQLPWEKLASSLLRDQGLAVVIDELKCLSHLINENFLNPMRLRTLHERREAFFAKNPSPHAFATIIGDVAETLLSETLDA